MPTWSWADQIDKAAYVGDCNVYAGGGKKKVSFKHTTLEEALDPKAWASGKKPRDVTQQLKTAAANAQKNGAKVTAIDCFDSPAADYDCPTTTTAPAYSGSNLWWDSPTDGLGPEVCQGDFSFVLGQCKNGNTFKTAWAQELDLSSCKPASPDDPDPPHGYRMPNWMLYSIIGGAAFLLLVVLLISTGGSPARGHNAPARLT